MKRFIGFGIAFLVCVCGAISQDVKGEAKAEKAAIEGVKGTVYRINGNKQKESKVTCRVGDVVEIDWTYPIAPPFPSKATQHSSDAAIVKGFGIHGIINVGGLIGTGELGAFFKADKNGQADLTFTIWRGTMETVLKCAVQVK
jgi:hypothetical protein